MTYIPICMNCESKRKDRLKKGRYKGKEIVYCSNWCLEELLRVLKVYDPPHTSTNP